MGLSAAAAREATARHRAKSAWHHQKRNQYSCIARAIAAGLMLARMAGLTEASRSICKSCAYPTNGRVWRAAAGTVMTLSIARSR